jgi:hypothetical protein
LPLLSGLFTFVLGAYLYCVTGLESAHFHLRRPPPTADLHSIPRLADDVLSRLIWWAGAIGLAFTMIVATVVAIYLILRVFEGSAKARTWAAIALVAGALLPPILCYTRAKGVISPHLSRDILELTLGSGTNEGEGDHGTKAEDPHREPPIPGDPHDSLSGLNIVKPLNCFLGCTLSVLVLMMAAFGATLVPSGSAVEPADGAHTRMQQMQLLLYISAILLVAGVFELYALLRWPIAYYAEPADQAAIKTVAAAGASAAGVFFSLLLASVYVPSAALQRFLTTSIAANARPKDKKAQREWLKDRDLYTTPIQILYRVLAILGPSLAGLLGGILKQLA